jgi:hypothetical protein
MNGFPRLPAASGSTGPAPKPAPPQPTAVHKDPPATVLKPFGLGLAALFIGWCIIFPPVHSIGGLSTPLTLAIIIGGGLLVGVGLPALIYSLSRSGVAGHAAFCLFMAAAFAGALAMNGPVHDRLAARTGFDARARVQQFVEAAQPSPATTPDAPHESAVAAAPTGASNRALKTGSEIRVYRRPAAAVDEPK